MLLELQFPLQATEDYIHYQVIAECNWQIRTVCFHTVFSLPVFTVLSVQELHGTHGVQLFSLQSIGMSESASRAVLEKTLVLQTETEREQHGKMNKLAEINLC